MSGKSCGSGSVRSCGGGGGGGGSVRLGAAGPHDLVLDALYERKRDKKSVRVLTVIIYVFCVSLAAIMLSLYYVFFWEPKDAQYAQRKVAHNVERQTSTTPMPTCFMPYTGGSNTTMSENITQHINITDDGFWNANDTLDSGASAGISEELFGDVAEILRVNSSHADGGFNFTGTIT